MILGAEIYRVKPEGREETERDPDFEFDIALYEPSIVEGEPVVPVLRQLLDTVNSVVNTFAPLL